MKKNPLSDIDRRSIKARKHAWKKANKNRVIYRSSDLREIKRLKEMSDLANAL